MDSHSDSTRGVHTRISPISASRLFDDNRTSRFAVATVFALGGVLVGAVAWSAAMPLAEISTSEGEVVTSIASHRVQHLEGGIVSSVLVEEGQRVNRGQRLVVLAPKIAETELSQLRTRRAAAEVRILLLTAALEGGLSDALDLGSEHRAIVAAEVTSLSARRESIERQVDVLRQQVVGLEADIATLDVRASSLADQLDLGREKILAQRDLLARGNFPRLQLIDGERDLSRLTGERAEVEAEKLRVVERIAEAETRIAELQAIFRAELAVEIGNLTQETAELDLAISQAEDRVERLLVTAPIAGWVQDLQVGSAGGVVAPGAVMMDIVPKDSNLLVEARISTADVGHIKTGQLVEVKVETFDYSRFGKIDGEIARISPTTFLDPEGRPYYEATIDLANDHVGSDDTLRLSPGMTVTADIVTGERTLLEYLATPVIRSLDSGLRER